MDGKKNTTKHDLVLYAWHNLPCKYKLNKGNIKLILETMFETIEEGLLNHEKVILRGLGIFYPGSYIKRVRHNFVQVNTTQHVTRTIFMWHKMFKPTKSLKERVNGAPDIFEAYNNSNEL